MKKYLYLLLTCFAIACSDEEDVSPSGIEQNMFASPDFSSEEEMAIREDFREQTGIYIVFNDSLCWREVETPQGAYQMCEMLDLNYELSSMSRNEYTYTLLSDIQKKKAMADFVREELLPLINKALYPYAVFIVNDFGMTLDTGGWTGNMDLGTVAAWACFKATIIGENGVLQMSEAEKEAYKRQFVRGILFRNYDMLDESAYAEFYSYCEGLYGEWISSSEAESVGFLLSYTSTSYYEQEYDVRGYILEVFSMTREEFDEKYADYPVILQKRDALVRGLEANGMTVY